jgi:hypothetical protein
MPHILKNKNLEIHIDFPEENYNFSRFDWTGKIVKVKFKNTNITSIERTNSTNENHIGKGFYNEFGIETPLNYQETLVGDWFHKIGVGLLKKTDDAYDFLKNYEVKPAEFEINSTSKDISIICTSKIYNGYGYILKKEITLFESSFEIKYWLQNIGNKSIVTNEYNHNFMAINNEFIDMDYILKFPFHLKPQLFSEKVNVENAVDIQLNEFRFNRTPIEPFFFSNLSTDTIVNASWELINLKKHIGISETGSFQTNKINFWGWKHVISPELFFNINLQPNETVAWSRTYKIFRIK